MKKLFLVALIALTALVVPARATAGPIDPVPPILIPPVPQTDSPFDGPIDPVPPIKGNNGSFTVLAGPIDPVPPVGHHGR